MGLVPRGEGPSFPYAGSPLSVLSAELPFACAARLLGSGPPGATGLPENGPPDPDVMRDHYEAHGSHHLQP